LVDDAIVVVMAVSLIFIFKTMYPLFGGNDTYLMLAYNPIFIICCINLIILNLPCKGWNQTYPIRSWRFTQNPLSKSGFYSLWNYLKNQSI
jgi:predicted glycosyltransferase involved in capsule biosynthesis